jgi:hypothetical protein
LRGVFQFNNKGLLTNYSFLFQDIRTHSVNFDAAGNANRVAGQEVVQWYFKPVADSIELAFLLLTLNAAYTDLALFSDTTQIENLFVAGSEHYAKTIRGQAVVEKSFVKNGQMIYLKGRKKEPCSGHESPFTDSILFNL